MTVNYGVPNILAVYGTNGIALSSTYGGSVNTWIDTSGNIYSQNLGATRLGILNFTGAGTSNTYAGMYYDSTNNRLVVGGLTGGVAWRNVYVAPNATLVADVVSKGSGSFRIPHPLPSKSTTNQLVHSFIEGPYCDLIYRGTAVLNDGVATVDIDAHFGMTEGTFVALCANAQVFVTNQTDWSAVRGSVLNNVLTITCQDSTSKSTVNWMIIAERHDPHIINTEWTDSNGRPILEPAYNVNASVVVETPNTINPPATVP